VRERRKQREKQRERNRMTWNNLKEKKEGKYINRERYSKRKTEEIVSKRRRKREREKEREKYIMRKREKER